MVIFGAWSTYTRSDDAYLSSADLNEDDFWC